MTHEVLRHHVLAGINLQATGRTAPPGRDLLSGGAPCYGVYRTGDGRHVAVGALELKFWRALCEALQRPEWADRHWSLGLTVGGAEAMALRDALAALFATRPLQHWSALFDGTDACVTPVLRLDEALAHPWFRRRDCQPPRSRPRCDTEQSAHQPLQDVSMKTLIAAIIASAFSLGAFAQSNPAPAAPATAPPRPPRPQRATPRRATPPSRRAPRSTRRSTRASRPRRPSPPLEPRSTRRPGRGRVFCGLNALKPAVARRFRC